MPHFRYPANLCQAPFDKWILFEARSGRHIVRNQVVAEQGGSVERTLASVGLYMSETALKSAINVNYDQTDLGAFAGAAVELLAQTGQNLFDVRYSSAAEAKNSVSQLLKNITSRGRGAVNSASAEDLSEAFAEVIKADVTRGVDGLFGNGVSAALFGQKANPRTDMLFDSTNFRQHEFSFLLVPRSRQEAEHIDGIIRFFQFYSLPSYRNGDLQQNVNIGAFMIGFPYEFEISFRDENGRVMERVNKVGRSVLTSVGIDHAAGGKTAFVRDNGELFPVATALQLCFTEVRLLDRASAEIDRPSVPELSDPRA